MQKPKLKGFTLIEMIVVMAIIAVLSTVLVPNMIAYIIDSKFSTANQNAKLVYNAAAQYCVEYAVTQKAQTGTGTTLGAVDINSEVREVPDALFNTGAAVPIERYTSRFQAGTNVFVTTLSMQDAVNQALGNNLTGSFYFPEVNHGGGNVYTVEAVYWSENDTSTYVGCYPDKIVAEDTRRTLAEWIALI